MILKEERADLFNVPYDYYLAHCISSDFEMGKGIVVEFNKRFDLREKMMQKYPDYLEKHRDIYHNPNRADCILENRVLNLITKEIYWMKPTYESLSYALFCMLEICMSKDISKIAMPKIGCGLDRLEWYKVKEIIFETFKDTNIEILVCYI